MLRHGAARLTRRSGRRDRIPRAGHARNETLGNDSVARFTTSAKLFAVFDVGESRDTAI